MPPSWNLRVATLFGVVLVLTGVLGLVLPAAASPMSNALPYDLFHVAFGCVGIACGLSGRERLGRAFNAGFGAIDLYQAVASVAGWWPKAQFAWRPADDVLHVAIGLALVAVGLLADRTARLGGPGAPS